MGGRSTPPRCHFCGSKKLLLDGVLIGMGMGGDTYAFCEDCLRSNSAYKFWYNFFDTIGYQFPGNDEEVTDEPGPNAE